MSHFVLVWHKIYSIWLIYRILWNLIWTTVNLYGAWFNMSQQKAAVNLAFKYTHEMRPESYENLNYLKLHYFPRHTWGHSRKNQHLGRCCLSAEDYFWSKIKSLFAKIFDKPEFWFGPLNRVKYSYHQIVRLKSFMLLTLIRCFKIN